MGATGNAVILGIFIIIIIAMMTAFGIISIPESPTTIQPDEKAEPIDWTPVYVAMIAIPVAIFFLSGLRIVRQTHRAVIETFGKYSRFMSSGITWVIPIVQRLYQLNVTEQLVDVKKQDVITSENLNANVDAQVYYRVGDTEKALKNAFYNVDDVNEQMVQLAKTTLRAVIGQKPFKEVNSNRAELNNEIFDTLKKETVDWGITIVRVELKEITPPDDVQDTMNAIIKAENTRDAEKDLAEAKKIEAMGDKKARIERAEGFKREKILQAEGERKAIQEVADGNKYEIEKIAIADAERIKKIAAARAEEIQKVNDSANKHFIENAKDLKSLEVTQESLKNNAKVIMTEKGMSPNLIVDTTEDKEKKMIVPLPADRRSDKSKSTTESKERGGGQSN